MAVGPVGSGLVDFIRQHSGGIAAKFAPVILHSGLQITAFVEILPAGLLQINVAIHHGKVQFLPKFRRVGTLAPLDRPDMGLLQTDDPILAFVGAIVVHLFLLAVHNGDHIQAVPQPAGVQGACAGNKRLIFFQLPGGLLDIVQLLTNGFPALGLGPLLAFGQLQIGLPGLFRGIWQLVAGMRHLFPQNVVCRFQMLPALVQQLDVRRIFDVSWGHRGVQKQFSSVLFPSFLFPLGRVFVCFPLLPRLFSLSFAPIYRRNWWIIPATNHHPLHRSGPHSSAPPATSRYRQIH